MRSENIKRITIRLDEGIYKLLKIHCVNTNQSMQQMIEKLIEKEVSNK